MEHQRGMEHQTRRIACGDALWLTCGAVFFGIKRPDMVSAIVQDRTSISSIWDSFQGYILTRGGDCPATVPL